MAKASKSKVKLDLQDQRMIELIDYAVKTRFATKEEYFDRIGFHRQNLTKIKRGEQPFSQRHIYEACKALNVNANWIFGFEENQFRINSKATPIQRIKDAVADLEREERKRK